MFETDKCKLSRKCRKVFIVPRNERPRNNQQNQQETNISGKAHIYLQLKLFREAKCINFWYTQFSEYSPLVHVYYSEYFSVCNYYREAEGYLLDCRDCAFRRGCCVKRKLILSMTQRNLDWLDENEVTLREEQAIEILIPPRRTCAHA